MNKKKLIMGAALLASMSMMACSSKGVKTTDQTVLPKEAQTTISKYYSGVNVSQIKVDKEAMGTDDYEVLLSNGTKIEFDNAGAIKEVKAGANDTVPSAFVPEKIIAYVDTNYSSQKVVKIDFGKNDIEVKLSSGIELKFDNNCNFLKID